MAQERIDSLADRTNKSGRGTKSAPSPFAADPTGASLTTEAGLNSRQQTVLAMQQTRGNQYVRRALAKQRLTNARSSANHVQRYQAGDEGHGGIEHRALTASSVGFSNAEASQIYFGNWLRDFSQLNGSGAVHGDPGALYEYVIKTLGWGEYNREITPQELGTYVPSEHLDNPNAGGTQVPADKQTVEDPAIQALASLPEGDPRRQPFDQAFARLSPEQQAAYRSEEARRTQITEASARTGLPEYIERGKMHAKDTLIQAVQAGRTPQGRELMGNALHAVEDYFSHSNFVDVALWTLHNEGVAAADPYVSRMVENMHGTNPALVGGVGTTGQPNIITGTYSPGANDWVSRLELLKAQLHSGEFAKAFIVGLIRRGTVSLADVSRTLCGGLGAGIVGGLGWAGGGLVGGVTGMGSGAMSGASQGFDDAAARGYQNGYNWAGGGVAGQAIGQAEGALEGAVGSVTGFFGGAWRGMTGGASSGAASGWRGGSALGRGLGSVCAAITSGVGAIVLGEAELQMLLSAPFIKAAMAPGLLIIDQAIEAASNWQTTQSGVQAARRGVTGPTHSQIAKDSPDHPLYGVSVALAEYVDQDFGRTMMVAWGAESANPNAADSVTALVDKYVSQPSSDPWWRSVLIARLGSR